MAQLSPPQGLIGYSNGPSTVLEWSGSTNPANVLYSVSRTVASTSLTTLLTTSTFQVYVDGNPPPGQAVIYTVYPTGSGLFESISLITSGTSTAPPVPPSSTIIAPTIILDGPASTTVGTPTTYVATATNSTGNNDLTSFGFIIGAGAPVYVSTTPTSTGVVWTAQASYVYTYLNPSGGGDLVSTIAVSATSTYPGENTITTIVNNSTSTSPSTSTSTITRPTTVLLNGPSTATVGIPVTYSVVATNSTGNNGITAFDFTIGGAGPFSTSTTEISTGIVWNAAASYSYTYLTPNSTGATVSVSAIAGTSTFPGTNTVTTYVAASTTFPPSSSTTPPPPTSTDSASSLWYNYFAPWLDAASGSVDWVTFATANNYNVINFIPSTASTSTLGLCLNLASASLAANKPTAIFAQRGITYPSSIITGQNIQNCNGLGSTLPFILGAMHPLSTAPPLFLASLGLNHERFIAIANLDFYDPSADPTQSTFNGQTSQFESAVRDVYGGPSTVGFYFFDNLRAAYFRSLVEIQNVSNSTTTNTVIINNCHDYNCYGENFARYLYMVNDGWMNGGTSWMAGWTPSTTYYSTGYGKVDTSQATYFQRPLTAYSTIISTRITNHAAFNAAATGIELRTNGVINGCLLCGNPVMGFVGPGTTEQNSAAGPNIIANTIADGGGGEFNLSIGPTNPRGLGLFLNAVSTGSISSCLVINKPDSTNANFAYEMQGTDSDNGFIQSTGVYSFSNLVANNWNHGGDPLFAISPTGISPTITFNGCYLPGETSTGINNTSTFADSTRTVSTYAVKQVGLPSATALATAMTQQRIGAWSTSLDVQNILQWISTGYFATYIVNSTQTLQTIANATYPGAVIVVQPGNYAGFQQTISGTSTQPIVWYALPGVNITSSNPITADGIDIEGASYIHVLNFNVLPSSTTLLRTGLRSVNNIGVLFQGNTLVSTNFWGILTGFSEACSTIDNNISYVRIQHGIYHGNSADYHVVAGNTITGCYACGIEFNGDSTTGASGLPYTPILFGTINHAQVYNNTLIGNAAGAGASINGDGLRSSYIHDNVILDAQRNGIALYIVNGAAPDTGNIIANNTILVNSNSPAGYAAVSLIDGAASTTVVNNFLSCAENTLNVDSASQVGMHSDYNFFGTALIDPTGGNNYTQPPAITLATWQSTTGQDAHSQLWGSGIFENFVSASTGNVNLISTAGAIGAGTSTDAAPSDIYGNPRPSPAGHFDIGAVNFY